MLMTRASKSSAGGEEDVTTGPIHNEPTEQRDPIRWLVACGCLLITAIAVCTAIMIGSFREHALDASKRELENDVLLLAKHFDQQLDDLEFPLNEFVRQTHLAGIVSPDEFDRRMSTPETHQLMKSMVSGVAKIAGMNIYDAKGDLINSSEVEVVPAVNIADRAYFKALKSSPEATKPQVELVKSRFSKEWRTLIARKVVGVDGQFLGIVSRAVAPAKFEQFFSSVTLGEDTTISIVHHDGSLLARYPHIEEIIGKNLSKSGTGLLSSGNTTKQLISPVDGRERLISVRSLDRFPLFVVASTTVASSLSDWRAQTRLIILAAGASVLVIAITLALIVARLTGQHRASQRRLMLEKNRFEAALDNMTQGLCLFDADKKLVIANSRLRDMYGLPDQLMKPGTPFDLLVKHHADHGTRSSLSVDESIKGSTPTLLQHLVLADGRKFSIKRTPTADGGWVATHEDVTEQRRQEKLLAEKAVELELMNQRFDAALGNMSQGISMFDHDKRLVVWNARYAELYQLPQTLLSVGTPRQEIYDHLCARGMLKTRVLDSDRESEAASEQGILAVQPTSGVEELSDGRSILASRRPMPGGGWLTTHEDITERRRAEREIIHLARHDALTGLANRAEFNARLEEASRRIRTSGDAVTVLMLDLDKFKAVNDTLGHPAGDKLLIEVARRLKNSVGEMDMLARLGGDEFAIIQDGCPDQRAAATALALRIIEAITRPFDLDGHQATVGASIGIALAPEHGVEPEELLKSADLALYSTKAEGRNDFRLFQPAMLEMAQTQQSAENVLREAIAREEFQLHYQPVVDAKTRQLCGVEALVRWQHPSKGLVAPDQFIPLAESTGLIVPLGDWVLERACQDAASWPAHLKVAVNISAVQFKKADLFDIVLRVLLKTGIEPRRLELEITETALLENQDAYLATIRRLKNLGISIALDDFGTGYSSINYLTVFPFDKIKIDKSYTRDILTRRDCKAVVASTLALARGLGTVTTAEGVETEEQLAYMCEAGVDLVQGYLCGRPVPISEFELEAASPRLGQLVA